MHPPSFWQNRGLMAQMLRPLAAITAAVTARRVARAGTAIGIPVICVGNINAGGTGKTPTVIAVVERLIAAGRQPFVVSRGYGGRLAGPVAVNQSQHSAADVGDEPLLLSAFAPVIVARNRAAGAMLAKSMGADVVVLDDGLQNPSLIKDLSIVVVDAAIGFGNGFCMPAGPLREPVAAGMARADLVLSIGDGAAQLQFAAQHGGRLGHTPHLTASLQPMTTGMQWNGAKVVAFAGIGRPEKFFSTLRNLGAQIIHAEPLADHAPLPDALLARLLAQARGHGADLVTTEKDAVRLPARFRTEVISLPVRLALADWSAFDAAISKLSVAKD